ncbi:MAG: ABC transporter permease [Planctomycetaceae bacterium]|nr:ABC transporter permease [Planctomycetaceae bacterium]
MGQLILCRIREFVREPEAVFWVYGFPILTVVALGIAFRNRPVEQIQVDVADQRGNTPGVVAALKVDERFVVTVGADVDWRRRLRTGKTALVVVPGDAPGAADEYWYDRSRPESVLARSATDDILQRAAGRVDVLTATDRAFDEAGGRYVDFLVPGLLGMSLMGGGLWGVGFVTVDMRIRKLLKRFLATPMRRSDFLAGIMISRMAFLIPEVLVLLLFSRLAFGVVIHGSLWTMAALILLGAFTFAGIGLLVASRAKTLEAVSGLMNLVMLPMWILSGIFFSSDRFPAVVQPLIKALPLTLLIDALRSVALEGASLAGCWSQVAGLAAWAGITFLLALKLFRWN